MHKSLDCFVFTTGNTKGTEPQRAGPGPCVDSCSVAPAVYFEDVFALPLPTRSHLVARARALRNAAAGSR